MGRRERAATVREVPVLSTRLKKQSSDTLVNVNSRSAVHSTATASVLQRDLKSVFNKKKEFPALLYHISYHQRPWHLLWIFLYI